MGESKKEPIAKFKAGAMSVSIWSNEAEKDGRKFSFLTAQFQRSYKLKDEWVNEKVNFGKDDIPKAILVLNEAFKEMSLKDMDKDAE